MSSTDVRSQMRTYIQERRPAEVKLEVVVVPVSDVDRAKHFYQMLGWRVDADLVSPSDDFREVQLTPPGSGCSIIIGTGVTSAVPGSVQGLHLIVWNIESTRAELIRQGVEVSDIFHDKGGIFHHAGTVGRVRGLDPERRSYASFASFSDPDGNGWVLQEIRKRLPGRSTEADATADVGDLANLLRETAERHEDYEKAHPQQDWWTWYAPYINARTHGRTPEEASSAAELYVRNMET